MCSPQPLYYEQCHLEIQVHSEPVNLTLFENRVFGDVTHLGRSHKWSGEGSPFSDRCLHKEDFETSAPGKVAC